MTFLDETTCYDLGPARTLAVPRPHAVSARCAEVLMHARSFAVTHAATPEQRRLLETALQGLEAQAAEDEGFFIHLPLLVHAAIRGDDAPAVPLAAATSLLFLGIDILDDLADGDRPGHWNDYSHSEINLAAATLLSALPQLVIAELDASPATLALMQRTLARSLLRMSAGQQIDLAMNGARQVTAQAMEAMVSAKSGEEVALFAALAAQLAGATPAAVERFAEMGRALGTAGQLASDCHDLFNDPRSRDLAHGSRTLPMALRLEKLAGAARAQFLDLLENARHDETARIAVRRQLRAGGELRHSAFIVQIHLQRALRLLEELQPLEPAATDLRALTDRITFFPKGEQP